MNTLWKRAQVWSTIVQKNCITYKKIRIIRKCLYVLLINYSNFLFLWYFFFAQKMHQRGVIRKKEKIYELRNKLRSMRMCISGFSLCYCIGCNLQNDLFMLLIPPICLVDLLLPTWRWAWKDKDFRYILLPSL